LTSPSVILALFSSGDPLLPLVDVGMLFVSKEPWPDDEVRDIADGNGGGGFELVRSGPDGLCANWDFDRGRLGMRLGGRPLMSAETGCEVSPGICIGCDEGPAVADVSRVDVWRVGANVDFVRLRGDVGMRLTGTELGGPCGKGTDVVTDESDGDREGDGASWYASWKLLADNRFERYADSCSRPVGQRGAFETSLRKTRAQTASRWMEFYSRFRSVGTIWSSQEGPTEVEAGVTIAVMM